MAKCGSSGGKAGGIACSTGKAGGKAYGLGKPAYGIGMSTYGLGGKGYSLGVPSFASHSVYGRGGKGYHMPYGTDGAALMGGRSDLGMKVAGEYLKSINGLQSNVGPMYGEGASHSEGYRSLGQRIMSNYLQANYGAKKSNVGKIANVRKLGMEFDSVGKYGLKENTKHDGKNKYHLRTGKDSYKVRDEDILSKYANQKDENDEDLRLCAICGRGPAVKGQRICASCAN